MRLRVRGNDVKYLKRDDWLKYDTFWAFLHGHASLNFTNVYAPEPALPLYFLWCELASIAHRRFNDEKHHFNDIHVSYERCEFGQVGLDYFDKIRRWPTLI